MSGAASTLIAAAPREGVRHMLTPAAWAALPEALVLEPGLALLALWAEPGFIHAAFFDEPAPALLLASAPVAEARYPALSPARPGAMRFERMVRDLWGMEAVGGDDRPWLDHGRWAVIAPMSARPMPNTAPPLEPRFLPVEGEGVHQIPVGPVHAGIIEPGHFRFHVQGETVVRLEALLGYTHKGTLGLMLGRSPRAAARFAARLSGDSTVAHAFAFARAAEAAIGTAPPPRAIALRGAMAELERIHNHLNDFGFICNDASFAWIHARCATLREGLLRATRLAFGHRLMMDAIIPGGVAQDLAPQGAEALLAALDAISDELPAIGRVYDTHASLQDRVVATGVLDPTLVARFGAGGYVGRASARGFDARTALPYPPYDTLPPVVPVLTTGDVDGRARIRRMELPESIRLARTLIERLPEGELVSPLPQRAGEGVAMVEGFRGECLAWLRLDDGGLIRGVFLRDPSWLHWPLLEAAVRDNIVADFPLINKSINASYSGVDL
ncbi:MAG: nickel-dependent hydrogenase large subunit [Pseudomonadota bacterium]